MTELLERAIAQRAVGNRQIKNLACQRTRCVGVARRRHIAAMILEELEDDRRWDESFSRSPDILAKLSATALAEYHAGKTQELDPETL